MLLTWVEAGLERGVFAAKGVGGGAKEGLACGGCDISALAPPIAMVPDDPSPLEKEPADNKPSDHHGNQLSSNTAPHSRGTHVNRS